MTTATSSSSQPGREFEGAVAHIHALMAPGAQVTHDEVLVDRLGHSRQFDVVVRAKLGAYDLLGVIECKDLKRKVGTPEVNAFADKAANVKANLKVIASRAGFSRQAVELAAFHGISLISLLKKPKEKGGFIAPSFWYVKARRWVVNELTLFTEGPGPGNNFVTGEAQVLGQSLEQYLGWVFDTRHLDVSDPGQYEYELTFGSPQPLTFGEEQYALAAVRLRLTREERLLRQRVNYVGTAYYDWHLRRMVLPPGCAIQSEGVKMDLRKWEPVEAMDTNVGPFVVQLVVHEQWSSTWPQMIDLATLGSEALRAA